MEKKSFPEGWFDLSDQMYTDFGIMSYLLGISESENKMSLSELMYRFEPALRLNQYRIFRSKGFPRAFLTWAVLDPQNEYKFAIENEHFGPDGWQSGTSLWIVDLVSPFGHVDEIRQMLVNVNITLNGERVNRVRALRQKKTGIGEHKVLQWQRNSKGEVKHRIITKNLFRKKLEETING